MQLAALEHVARVALELIGPEGSLVVVGSSSLLASFPDLGTECGLLGVSYDADVIPNPFTEEIGVMLHESLGEDRRFHQIHGYHVDVLRPKIGEQFPPNWEYRLVSLAGVPHVKCLEPHDLAAAKCRTGREKDIDLLAFLAKAGKIDLDLVEERLSEITMIESQIVVSRRNLHAARSAAED